jgi:hypothetical protein
MNKDHQIIDLNVGGTLYTTQLKTLLSEPNSIFSDIFETKKLEEIRDGNNRLFIDRDGLLFRYILEYLRNKKLIIQVDDINEKIRLKNEAEYYKLSNLIKLLEQNEYRSLSTSAISIHSNSISSSITKNSSIKSSNVGKICSGYITVGFRGKFTNSHAADMHSFELTDLKFRKISRIMVSGRVKLCREIFGETLSERFFVNYFDNLFK